MQDRPRAGAKTAPAFASLNSKPMDSTNLTPATPAPTASAPAAVPTPVPPPVAASVTPAPAPTPKVPVSPVKPWTGKPKKIYGAKKL